MFGSFILNISKTIQLLGIPHDLGNRFMNGISHEIFRLELGQMVYKVGDYLVGGIPTPLKNDGVRQLG